MNEATGKGLIFADAEKDAEPQATLRHSLLRLLKSDGIVASCKRNLETRVVPRWILEREDLAVSTKYQRCSAETVEQ